MREADQIKNVITGYDMKNIIRNKMAIMVEIQGVHHMVLQEVKTHTDRKKVIWTQSIIFESELDNNIKMFIYSNKLYVFL